MEPAMTRVILLTLGIIGCMQSCIGPARADQAQVALQALCGAHGEALAPLVAREAHRQLIAPTLLVSVIGAENRNCRAHAVNSRTGAAGLMQILPLGSANPRGLPLSMLLDPSVSIELGARHLAILIVMCGTIGGALHVYHGYSKCSGWRKDRYVLGVLGLLPAAQRRS
jgi:hypothetical protein